MSGFGYRVNRAQHFLIDRNIRGDYPDGFFQARNFIVQLVKPLGYRSVCVG